MTVHTSVVIYLTTLCHILSACWSH
jgi:hypothetical protein